VVKWFVTEGESGVDGAVRLLQDHADGTIRLVAPALLMQELFGVLMRGQRDHETGAAAIEAFFDADVALVPPSQDLMLSAARLVLEQGASTLDSACVALAQALDCELATADRRLARAGEGLVDVREV
jgi:predicted nucleic acid-binding protein